MLAAGAVRIVTYSAGHSAAVTAVSGVHNKFPLQSVHASRWQPAGAQQQHDECKSQPHLWMCRHQTLPHLWMQGSTLSEAPGLATADPD